jgi:hypothetical protein
MKDFWIYTLTVLMLIIGISGYGLYFMIDSYWRFLFMAIGFFFLGIPDSRCWEKYFKEIFKDK